MVNASPTSAVSSPLKKVWERGTSVSAGGGGTQQSKNAMMTSPYKSRTMRGLRKKMTAKRPRRWVHWADILEGEARREHALADVVPPLGAEAEEGAAAAAVP